MNATTNSGLLNFIYEVKKMLVYAIYTPEYSQAMIESVSEELHNCGFVNVENFAWDDAAKSIIVTMTTTDNGGAKSCENLLRSCITGFIVYSLSDGRLSEILKLTHKDTYDNLCLFSKENIFTMVSTYTFLNLSTESPYTFKINFVD